MSRVRTIPRKAPNIQYPIILASGDTNTSTNTNTCVDHNNDHKKIPKLYDDDNDCV